MTRCHGCAGLASEKVSVGVYVNCSLRVGRLAAWIGVGSWGLELDWPGVGGMKA